MNSELFFSLVMASIICKLYESITDGNSQLAVPDHRLLQSSMELPGIDYVDIPRAFLKFEVLDFVP